MSEENDKCLVIWKNQEMNEKEREWKDDLFPEAKGIEMKQLNSIIKQDYCLYDNNNIAGSLFFSKKKNKSNPAFAEIISKLSHYSNILLNCFIVSDIKQCFKVKLFIKNKWQIILLDTFFPYDSSNEEIDFNYFTPIGLTNQIWPIVLEKAIAKINGGYEPYKLVSPSIIFKQITSFPCEEFNIDIIQMDLMNMLPLNEQCLIIANTSKDNHSNCVSIVQTAQAEVNEVTEYLLLIHSSTYNELKGNWSKYSSQLNSLNAIHDDDNSYWISLNDFTMAFNKITFCHFFFDSYYNTLHIEESLTQSPIAFMVDIKETCKVSLTLSLDDKEIVEMSLLEAKLSSFDNNRTIEVKGFNFSLNGENTKDILLNCLDGKYIFWLLPFQQLTKRYSITIMAQSLFSISSIFKDSDCNLIKRIITDNITPAFDSEDYNDIIQKQNTSFESSGLGYYYINNPFTDAYYIVSSNTELNLKDYKLLTDFPSKSKELTLFSNNCLLFLYQKRSDAVNCINDYNIEFERRNEKKLSEAYDDKALVVLIHMNESLNKVNYKTLLNITVKEKVAGLENNMNENEFIDIHSNLTKINFPISIQSEENGDDYQWTAINYKNAIYLGSITRKDDRKNGRGCLFFSMDNYYVGHWKDDQLDGFGTHYANKAIEYEGNFKNGKYDGQGNQRFDNGNKYEGQFKEGCFYGQGTLYFSQGNKYEGNFVNGIEEGYGKLIFANGDTFEGNFTDGKPNNFGVFTYEKGGYYKGMFEEGKRKGKGQLKFDGTNLYNGFFDNDQFNGYGVLHYSNGDTYEGYFKDGLRQGRGKLVFDEGDYYEGEFEKGEFTGEGTLCIGDSFIYKGTFEKGQFQGAGILNYFNGDIYTGGFVSGLKSGYGMEYLHNGDKYEGHFAFDKYEGTGKFVYSEGNTYEGSFSKGQFEGEGTLIFENGDKYEGSFNQGIREGKGYFFFDDGNIYEGDFKQDSFDGEGILYKKNGDIIEGKFNKGLLSGKAVYYPKDDLPYDIDLDENQE